MDIIETIAKRWFMYNICPTRRDNEELWDKQPESVKSVFIKKAQDFWDHPDDRFQYPSGLLYQSQTLEQYAKTLANMANSMREEYHYKKSNLDSSKRKSK